MKKNFSEEFKLFLKKTKSIKKEIKALDDIEKIVSDAIVKTFKPRERTYTLTDFGYLEKKEELKEGKKSVKIDFMPNSTLEKKVINKYKMNLRKKAQRKKMILFTILGILGLIVVIFLSSLGINNLVKYSKQKALEKSLHVDATDDVLYNSKENDLIISKNNSLNTNLKNGEYITEEVIINGIKYTKITYKVKKRDFLWKIGYRFVKNKYAWKKIHKDNSFIKNPHLIYPGEQIIIYIKKK